MGAAGDMLMAALLELHPDPDGFIARLNGFGIPGVAVERARSVKNGVIGTAVNVYIHGEEELEGSVHDEHHHHHHGSDMGDISHIVGALALPEQVKKDVLAVYGIIADAEAAVHGRPVDQVHFHEVGMMDAVADVTGVCLLMHEIGAARVIASPVCVGSGSVRCAHGVLSVPAPATERILRGVPIYSGNVTGELCTPTGAALLKYFVGEFGPAPVIRVEKTGYGMGKKDFDTANCLRVLLGETESSGDSIVELSCNLDDMTPEAVGFAQERLFEAGALDVFTTHIGMKKNRPGIMLTCMCRGDRRENMIRLMFMHTSTIGIREHLCDRYVLDREEFTRETTCGVVRFKRAEGWGVSRCKAEYEDVAKIAREKGISFAEAEKLACGAEIR